MALRIPSSIGDLDYDHGRNALLGDQVVQHVGDHLVGLSLRSVVTDHEGNRAALFVLSGNVYGYLPDVIDLVGLDDQSLGVLRIDLAEDLAGDPGVEQIGGFRIDGELGNFSPRRILGNSALGSRPVVRSDQEVPHRIDGRIDSRHVIQPDELRGARSIERPDRWLRALGLQNRRSEQGKKSNDAECRRGFHLVWKSSLCTRLWMRERARMPSVVNCRVKASRSFPSENSTVRPSP